MNKLTFLEALAYAESRSVVLPDEYYGKLAGVQKAQAVSIAGLASLDQIKFVIDEVAKAIREGKTFKDFQKSVKAGELAVDLPAHRLDNIFRTNMQAAYNRGRWLQQKVVSKSRPYLMYDAINDSRTRPAHAAMDNVVLHRDDPWWNVHYPPNGYRCRCTVISLTPKQAERRGITENAPVDTAKPDSGWDYNPGTDYDSSVKKALETKTAKLEDITVKSSADIAKAKALIEARAEAARNIDAMTELSKESDAAKYRVRVRELAASHPELLKALSPAELKFLYAYTTDSFSNIQSILRAADAGDLVVQEMLGQLQDLMNRAREHSPNRITTLYRNTALSNTTREEFERIHTEGSVIQARGFTSTSTSKDDAAAFEGRKPVRVRYTIKDSGFGVDVSPMSKFSDENEVLFAPGTGFRVVSSKYAQKDGFDTFLVVLEALGFVSKADNRFNRDFYDAMEGVELSPSAFTYWVARQERLNAVNK
jgi:SPP1 gp7 family putative phage head morphogenesis protein